jgi:hypothetical protein
MKKILRYLLGSSFSVFAFLNLAYFFWNWVFNLKSTYLEVFLKNWPFICLFVVCSFLALIIFRPTDEHN